MVHADESLSEWEKAEPHLEEQHASKRGKVQEQIQEAKNDGLESWRVD
jgi:hypothetical protein